MWATIITVSYVLGIVSAVDAVMSARTPQGSIAWAVSLITFPIIAVPAYWVLGRSKFLGMSGVYRDHQDELQGLIGRIMPRVVPAVDQEARDDRHKRVLQQITTLHFMRNNSVELLVDGNATFDSILEGIGRAEQYVLVHFYMFKVGVLGRRMADAMKEKAAEGVKVILLYDEVGSLGFPASFRRELLDAGVLVSEFGTTQGWRNRFQLNFRNHRKIVVVDGKVDTHVKITGPAALSAQAVVLGDWFWATRSLLELDWEPDYSSDEASVLVLSSGPADELETASLAACELCDMAKHRLWIASPYFVPDDAVISALRGAALRGVDVRIIVPDKSDNVFVDRAALWYIDLLKGMNIRFFRYEAGFLHSKTALVDDTISVIGTVNWDSRSFRLNFEVNAIVDDEALCDQMTEMFLRDFARSREMDGDELDRRGFLFRLSVRVCRLLAPVL